MAARECFTVWRLIAFQKFPSIVIDPLFAIDIFLVTKELKKKMDVLRHLHSQKPLIYKQCVILWL